jgi:LCP family protein required for cell wall assembly
MLSFAILIGSGVAWSLFRQLDSSVNRINVFGSASGKDIDGQDQNILMVGDDSREGASAEELKELGTDENQGENTDTMMVLHVPADGSKATIISFPRDLWVTIPGHGQGKLNSAYLYGKQDAGGSDAGGADLLGKVITNVTGLKMDHFVKVGLLGFLRISNALGGIDLCLNSAQNPTTDSDDYSSGYSGINLKAGWNYGVKGSQAVAFVRQRHGLPRGDLDRIVRQQYFLGAAFRKVSSSGTLLNPIKLQSLVTAISSSLTIDSNLNILKFAQQMKNLSAGNLTFATIPNTPNQWVGDISIVALNAPAVPNFIAQMLGKPDAYSKAEAAKPSTVTVNVLNNTSSNGVAEPNVTTLRQLGFNASVLIGPDVSDTTSIEYPSGLESGAKALAQYVPGATVVMSSAVTKVTLVLGNDGLKVNANPGAAAAPSSKPATSSAPATTSAPAATSKDPSTSTAGDAGCIN